MSPRDPKIAEIRARWTAAATVSEGWGSLPSARRERVLGEIEEVARETRERDEELARDFTAALDTLDLMGRSPTPDFVAQAVLDIRALLHALDEVQT
jgi:hypothetical protein